MLIENCSADDLFYYVIKLRIDFIGVIVERSSKERSKFNFNCVFSDSKNKQKFQQKYGHKLRINDSRESTYKFKSKERKYE